MKFVGTVVASLMLLWALVTAQEEDHEYHHEEEHEHHDHYAKEAHVDEYGEVHDEPPAAVDCREECAHLLQEAMEPVLHERDLAHQQNADLSRQMEEEIHRVQDEASRERAGLYEEIENLRKSLGQSREEDAKMRGLLDQKEQALVDAANKLSEAEAKSRSLEEELTRAKEEIDQLSKISFPRQLQKELNSLWQTIMQYLKKLKKE